MVNVYPTDKIYVMEKWVMSEGFPDLDLEHPEIKPYHDGWFVIATERDNKQLGDMIELDSIDEIINLLYPYSGKIPIIVGRHPLFPEEVNIEGDIEKYRGLLLESRVYVKFVDSKIRHSIEHN